MLQNYWKFQNRNAQTFGFVYHDTNGLQSWSSMEDPVVPLERNLYGHPLAGLLWERQCEKILLKYGWEKVSNRGMFICTPWKMGYSYLCMWMTSNWLERHKIIDPMWKVFNKEVDLGEPTSFLDHVYLACTKRQCEISKDIVDNYWTMFESIISAGATEKLLCSENIRIFSWSYNMEGHAKKCVERYCELAKQDDSTTSTKYLFPVFMTITFKEEELKSVGELSKASSQIVLKCLHTWHVLEDLIFSGQWTNLHDPLQNGPKLVTNDWVVWYLTSITHVNTNNIVMWETLQNNADWDCFKTPILQEMLRIQNLHQVELCAFFGSNTFVPSKLVV